MTLAVVFRRAARLEFDDAAIWYEGRRSGLGTAFVAEIDRAIAVDSSEPERFPIMHRAVRCVRVRRFPCSVVFRIESARIIVLAVFHASRDPAVWRARA